jgi:hypothetical protein
VNFVEYLKRRVRGEGKPQNSRLHECRSEDEEGTLNIEPACVFAWPSIPTSNIELRNMSEGLFSFSSIQNWKLDKRVAFSLKSHQCSMFDVQFSLIYFLTGIIAFLLFRSCISRASSFSQSWGFASARFCFSPISFERSYSSFLPSKNLMYL